MSTEIEAKEVTVGKLFSPDFMFEIPLYQRPLTWEKDNFEQLFEDIFDAMNTDQKQYFLGSIILQEQKDNKKKYDLVDGQQRISALAVLMAVIRDFTNISELKTSLTSYLYQKEDKYKKISAEMRIIPWQDLKNMFRHYIYQSGGTQKFIDHFEQNRIEYNDTQDPQYHLYEAISVFNKKLKEKLKDPDDLERFVKYVLNQVYLVYIKTPSFTSAFRLFNVLNTRGLPLNTSDLLKSENIGVIENETKRLQYANVWRDLENNLGREELEKVIGFIRTIQLKEKAKLSIYEEYRREIFEKGFLKKGTEFIDYVKEIADIYTDRILEGKITLGDPSKENQYKCTIDLLRRFVPFSDWVPPVLAFYHKFGADSYLFDFMSRLEKKIIIEWAAGFTPTERITILNRIIKLIDSEKEREKVVDGLLSYNGEEVFTKVGPRLIERLGDSQFYSIYGGKLAKYILLRIDMKYWDMENFTGYPGTITVEHILPQNPSENSEWLEIFDDRTRAEWTNRLGNLVLLSGRKNSKAQNYAFDKKKAVYFKEKSTAFRITRQLENNDKWTQKQLKERHEGLLNDAKEVFLSY